MTKASVVHRLALLFAWLTMVARAGYLIDTSEECAACTSGGLVACRQPIQDRFAFCCEESEVGRASCGGGDTFCSTQTLSVNM